MKYSELSADEREFLDSVHMAEQRSKAEYLSLLALLLHYMPKPSKGATHLCAEFENATRGDLKRAIKCILPGIVRKMPGMRLGGRNCHKMA